MTRDEWTAFDEDARTLRLAAIRDEWLANLAGFSWDGPRPDNPRWGTPQWAAMRERYFMLSDQQPSVEQAIFDAIARRKTAA